MCGQVLEAGAQSDTWSRTPLGQPLISSLLEHQAQSRDFQTVAMLVCALTAPTTSTRREEEERPERGPFWLLTGVILIIYN